MTKHNVRAPQPCSVHGFVWRMKDCQFYISNGFKQRPLLYCRLKAGSTLREFSPFVIVERLRYPMDMNETEQAVLDALLELEDKVAQMRTANPKPNLLPIFERLEALARQLPPGTDPELLHFLHRKSYEKARMLLQGRGGENQKGSCRK